MPARERIRDTYPIFFAFGDTHQFLDNDAAQGASVEGRIRSVWPYMVKCVLAFQKTLKPRERANFDPEDTLSELYVLLAERDHKWTPERGRYITFAGTLIANELAAIRDRARTVESPRNTSCRLRAYEKLEAEGRLSERRRKTAERVRRTIGAVGSIGIDDREPGPAPSADPGRECQDRDDEAARLAALKAAIRSLPPYDAIVLGKAAGLWGKPPRTVSQIAAETGRAPAEVRKAKARAYAALRDHLRPLLGDD